MHYIKTLTSLYPIITIIGYIEGNYEAFRTQYNNVWGFDPGHNPVKHSQYQSFDSFNDANEYITKISSQEKGKYTFFIIERSLG